MKNILKTLKVSYKRLLWFFNIKGRLANFIEDVVCKLESNSGEMEETARWVFNDEISDTTYELEELTEKVRYMKDDIKEDLLSDFDDKFDTIKDDNIMHAIENDVKYIAQCEAEAYFDNEIHHHTNELEDSIRDVARDLEIEAKDLRLEMKDVEAQIDSLNLEERIKEIISKQYTVELTLKPKE